MMKDNTDVSSRLRSAKRKRQLSDVDAVTPSNQIEPIPILQLPDTTGDSLVRTVLTQREVIIRTIRSRGGVLLRGFSTRDPLQLFELAQHLCGKVLNYSERSTPRSAMAAQVYSVSEYPAHQRIDLHNENAYAAQWPATLFFHCLRPADVGGESVLADSRAVLNRLSPATVAEFERRHVMYVREFDSRLGVSWQYAFQCEEPASVEARCTELGYRWEWFAGNRLRVIRVAPAIHRHPITEQSVWFSHATFFHESGLPSEILENIRTIYGDDFLPHRTFFGDGTPIGAAVLDDVRSAYRACSQSVLLHADDLLIVDNMLMAHGRAPYSGPREIRVVLGDLLGAEPCAGM